MDTTDTDVDENENTNSDFLDYSLSSFYEIGSGPHSLYVPKTYPIELIRRLNAAVRSFFMGISIGYTYNQYFTDWIPDEYCSHKSERAQDVFNTLEMISEYTINKLAYINNTHREFRKLPDTRAFMYAEVTFLRLVKSFKSTLFLLKNGLYFEANAIMKIILEQSCWALSVYNIADNSFLKVEPQKSITTAKKTIHDVGKLYGEINEFAHVNPRKIPGVFVAKQPAFKLNDFEKSMFAAIILIKVLDLYCIVFEKMFFNYVPNKIYINDQNQIIDDRDTILFLSNINERVDKLIK